MRWEHPERGMVYPADFIEQAEKTGLIVDFGHWALRCVCEKLAQWRKDKSTESLKVAINISARQFEQVDFVQKVMEILRKTGAKPERLIFELTESMLIGEENGLTFQLNLLKMMGITLALDDFGTGYSSLHYLARLPIDCIKIDRSFIKDLRSSDNANSIVMAIVSLGANIGLKIIAEGVETNEQWSTLREMGCSAYQGYLFGKPMDVSDLAL